MAIVARTFLDNACFEGGKIREGIDVENETYDVDSVVFSIAKKTGGEITKKF